MNERGFSTLLTIIVFGIVATAIASSILILGLRTGKTSLSKERYHSARAAVVSCAEHALFALREDLAFDGSSLPTFTGASCSVTILGTPGENIGRTLEVTATTEDGIYRVRVNVSQILPTTEISLWEEVTTF